MLYAPSDVEAATGGDLTPNVLRDWRRRGLLQGFGQSDDNGRWRYARREVCIFAIASHLADEGLTIERSMTLAVTACNAVIAWLVEEPTDFHLQVKARYPFVVAFQGRTGTFETHGLNDPGRLTRTEVGMCHLVNPRVIAESLPKLCQWYNAEKEAAKRD